MVIYVGMDDTDNLESRGTGALARNVAAALSSDYKVLGVIRQQLLRDPHVPCTKNNSSKALLLEPLRASGGEGSDLLALAGRVRELMLADFQAGSDPGLCVARDVSAEVVEFGRAAQLELLAKADAEALAGRHGIYLEELGGDGMGIIGALAAVGLTAWGDAGRYIQVGQARLLAGPQPVEAVVAAGVARVQTADGQPVLSGVIQADGLRPARRGGRPVAVVQQEGEVWLPLKLD
jgi:tRNA(Ile2) C34 agmatinyltransferase TiaS